MRDGERLVPQSQSSVHLAKRLFCFPHNPKTVQFQSSSQPHKERQNSGFYRASPQLLEKLRLGNAHIHPDYLPPDTEFRDMVCVLPWVGYRDVDFTMRSDAEGKTGASLLHWSKNTGGSETHQYLAVYAESACPTLAARILFGIIV